MNELDRVKAERLALKKEVSELGRLYELRGRELNTARKKADKADALKAELEEAKEKVSTLQSELAASERAGAALQARLDRTDDILADVAALKRLVS